MRHLLPPILTLFIGSISVAQGTEVAPPKLTQAIEFADGAALTIRYRAVPWGGDLNGRLLGAIDVTRGLKLGSALVPRGEYTVVFSRDGKGGAHLSLQVRDRSLKPMFLGLSKGTEHARRLELVITAGDQVGHAVVRVAFGDLTGRFAITTADSTALKKAVESAHADNRLATAKKEVQSILNQAQSYMVQNPGPPPTWEILLARDARGHRFIELDEPKLDPWGNSYVIANDPDFPNKPFVASWGPDGVEATEDDITNKSIRRRGRR